MHMIDQGYIGLVLHKFSQELHNQNILLNEYSLGNTLDEITTQQNHFKHYFRFYVWLKKVVCLCFNDFHPIQM